MNLNRLKAVFFCVVTCAFALSASAASVRAQTPANTKPDSTPKTPAEIIRERLRGMHPVGAPDSVASADSGRAQPQGLQVNGGAGPLGAFGGMAAGAAGAANGRGKGRGDAPAANIQRDSVWEKLLKLQGFNATEYKSDTAKFAADSSNLQLQGNAVVSRDGQIVEAGRITYSDSSSLVCGYGKPRVSGAGTATPLESDSLCYNIEDKYGVARGATTSISEGAVWRMYSPTLVTRGDDYYSKNAIFTDCDLPWDEVHYAFSARQVLARRNNTLVARDVTLRFKDVPVFWLPFMVQSLSQGRRSGILMPRFGVNDIARTSTRYARRVQDVGFYWAMNDYMGSEVAFDWMSNNWTALRGSFDYNFMKDFLRGGLTVRQYWKNEGGTDLTVASQNSWEPNERTRIQADANFATSSQFVRSHTFDPRELNRSIDSNFTLNRRFNFGALTIGSSRKQYLSDDTKNVVLPNASFSLSPVTLFAAQPGEEHWYNNATWTSSADIHREANLIGDANTNPSAQTRHNNTGRFASSFTLGKLRITQNYSAQGQHNDSREVPLTSGDSSTVLAASRSRSDAYDFGVDFSQRVIGTTTFTPSISFAGEKVSNTQTNNLPVSAPARLKLGASLNADAYGIFNIPIGPFEKFRHKFSPSISYNYSPAPSADSLQRVAFNGVGSVIETNRFQIGLNQTFEAKYKEKRDASQIAADSAAADTASGPKHLQTTKTIMLLGISTDAVAYDFVQARKEGTGFATTTIGNHFTSGLLPGFDVSITHDLFKPGSTTTGGVASLKDRKFSPALTNATANFSFSGNSWLFRILRLGHRDSMPVGPAESRSTPAEGGVPVNRTESEMGLIGTRSRYENTAPTGATGAWTARVQYSLVRPRSTGIELPTNSAFGFSNSGSTVTGDLSFQPTANWSATWNTTYSITRHQFADQRLSLIRRMHDWDAHFDFIKAQNGNFAFVFNVSLRANPDIKLDWSQNETNTIR